MCPHLFDMNVCYVPLPLTGDARHCFLPFCMYMVALLWRTMFSFSLYEFTWICFSQIRCREDDRTYKYGSLNENVFYSSDVFRVNAPACGPVWVGLRSVALLQEVCHGGVGFQSLIPFPVNSLFHIYGSRGKLPTSVPADVLASC